MANFTLQHTDINGGTPIEVKANKITVSGKRNLIATPNANLTGSIVEAQTQGMENPKIVINGVHFTNETGTLTFEDVLTLYKTPYDGDNPALLTLTYGNGYVVPSITGSTSGIPAVLESYTLPFDANDSRDGYLPVGSMTFIETK
jgi:hypothetical protein